MKIFFSGIKYRLRAVNQERLFSKLCEKQPIFFINRISHTEVEVFLKFKHEKKFEKNLRNFNVEVLSKEFKGVVAHVKSFLARLGAVSGLIVCMFLVLGLGRFVLKTEIIGLERLTKTEINKVLAENNISGIIAKRNINTNNVENIISKNFSNVGLVSVIIKGNTLLISIKEKISAGDYDKPEELTNLVAKHSGLITNINLISGTLKVKVGQIVKVGDVLVEPYIIDSSGEKRTVKADAEIVARVWYRGQEVHSSTRLETKRTGKTFRHTKMTFLGINLSKPLQQPPFESFESKTTSVCISKNTILPIIRQFTIFYETENVQVNQSFEDVKQEVFEKAKQKALQMLDEYEIISKEYFTTSESFGLTTVEYVIETEKLIN